MTVFYVCDVGLCNSDSKFQTAISPYSSNKDMVCVFLVWTRGTICYQNCFDFAESFRFARLPLILHVQVREKPKYSVISCEKKNWSLMFSVVRKIPILGFTIPVGNSASLVTNWDGGTWGWSFSVSTEHQWWILFVPVGFPLECATLSWFCLNCFCSFPVWCLQWDVDNAGTEVSLWIKC